MNDPVSRRRFLHMVGAVGGSAAVYRVAMGMGLTPEVPRYPRPDLMPIGKKRAPFVVILGAGISGLTAAYELSRKGYRVQVLEASHRAGGRNMTLRSGDLIDEVGDPRTCRFDPDPDLYFNAGPARIPGHHSALLDYCRELGVELAPFINDNRNAWVQDDAMFGGRRIRNREYMADTRGFVAELAAKCMTPEQLAAPFTSADHQKLLEYLRQFGELDERYRYRGTARAGLVSYNYTAPEQLKQPLDAQELLRSGFMYVMTFGENEDQSAMMMEPVGGMDRVVAGFMSKVGKYVRLRSQVESVRVNDNGVEVVYRSGGERTQLQADYCLNCIPLHIMAGINNNFPADYASGLAAVPRGQLFKIGLQMKERFWEREGIYGGISWTMQDIVQMWYPAHGIHRRKGVMLAAYTFSREAGEKWAAMTHAQRVESAIKQGEKLHPGYGDYVESSVSIPWARMNHMLGCSSQWDDGLRQQWFKRLQTPVGAHYLIGDQISYHPGWQEGAIHSAYNAIADIDRRVRGVYTTRTEEVGAA